MNDPRPTFDIAAEITRANAAHLPDAETLRQRVAAEQRQQIEQKIATDRQAYEGLGGVLKAALRRFGVWNTVAILPDLIREMADEEPGEDEPQSALDYRFAAEVVEAMLPATDLSYDSGRSRSNKRKEAMGKALINLGQVKP